jgi:bacterioferritin-associated ferredoxin
MSIRIDRCVCTANTFDKLLAHARQEDLSLPQLVEQTGASACCGMCRPYLRRAWRTGQTVFFHLLDETDEPE